MKNIKQHKQQPIDTIPSASGNIYLAMSFVFPFVILGTVFALNKVYPFGDRQIIIHDFYYQYYPFFSGLWHKLREGTLSTWSWTAGAGHDYIALFAYYLASPLNLLALIAPYAWLRESLTLALLFKIGFAGLFTSMFFRYTYKRSDLAVPVFSSLYALCAFTTGYYWNIIWFDSIALLPLVMLGFIALMREGKYKLYVIAVSLSVLANYYMGFFVCIFTAISFFSHCIIQKLSRKELLRKFGLIAAYSGLAVGISAALLIPAYFALKNGYDSSYLFTPSTATYTSFFSILGNLIAFTPPALFDGLPNLYCGMISILLAGLFFHSKHFSRREKIVIVVLLIFFLLSCNFKTLYFIINGFRLPKRPPFRFSFLISFIIVFMAYRAFLFTENLNKRNILAMSTSAALILLSAVLGPQQKIYVFASAALCIAYLLLFYFVGVKAGKLQTAFRALFLLLILAELSISANIAFKVNETTKNRNEYLGSDSRQIQALLKQRQRANNNFYRTGIDPFHTSNDPYLYNYNGISLFSSTMNADVARFMTGLGLFGLDRANSFHYADTSPLTSAFLNMRYFISYKGYPADNSAYWETVAQKGELLLLENKRCLPLGFMVKEELDAYVHRGKNTFLPQNDLFRRATGLKGNLFATTELTNDASIPRNNKNGMAIWNYKMPRDGKLYACCVSDTDDIVSIFNNDFPIWHQYLYQDYTNIFPVGNFLQDDIVTFTKKSSALLYIGLLDSELFDQGYNLLARAPLNLTKFTNTQVCGNVTALEDSLLYTSIPGDKNWSVYVDGTKSKIVLIDNAMIAVSLDKGYHEIEFRYFNTSLLVGIIVSLVSLGVFMVIALKKK